MLRAALSVLRERLPSSWQLLPDEQPVAAPGKRADATVTLVAPDGQRIVLVVEAKRSVAARDVQAILEQLAQWTRPASAGDRAIPVLVARYLPPSTRDRIAASGAGYVDATGNVRIEADRPALFLSDQGADSDPWRGPGRPRGGLKGEPAARVVRALTDFSPPYSIPQLAKRAKASTGATYRVIEFLEQEDLLVRAPYGPISDVAWRAILTRWSADYGLSESNQVRTYLEPRGLRYLTELLATSQGLEYVVTGSLAAEQLAPYAPPRLAMLYADDPSAVADAIGLRATESGANVVIAAPNYNVVFDRTKNVDGLRVAAPSQVAVDLLTGPGRSPSEATALLDWMEANESAWRR